MSEKNFRFELGQRAAIKCSGEQGEVTGRAEYAVAENAYLLRYSNNQGFAVEQWWPESALTSI